MVLDLASRDSLKGLVARDLVRVSKDRYGRQRSPEDQHSDHVRSAEAMGWTLAGPSYQDVGSASSYARKKRKDFERLMTDLREDAFGANVLMLWENSRGSRRESEWIELIDLAVQREVVFWIETRGRVLDPGDPFDRAELVKAAAEAALETNLLSVRVRRGTIRAAERGLPHGRTPYGYIRRYDERTRELIAQELHPDEAPVIKELFQRIAKGHSLYSITSDFEARGIEKRSGGRFTSSHLRSMLVNPAYMGVRVRDPERNQGKYLGPKTLTYKAVWDHVVSPALYRRVQRILGDSTRRTNRSGVDVRHWLSMIARCGVCGTVLRVTKVPTDPSALRYSCHSARGCSRIDKPTLDEFVEDLLLGWLSDPQQYRVLGQPSAGVEAKLEEVRRRLADEIGERDDLARRAGAREAGFTSVGFVATLAAGIEQRIEQLQAEERALSPSVIDGLIEPGPDVRTRWARLPLEARRLVARRLLVPGYVGEIRIKSVGRGRWRDPMPVEEQVVVVREGSGEKR
ncbi:MAG: recombinase family protein [Solirubrobacteraceae bacterium]